MPSRKEWKKAGILAAKVAVGSSLAIYIAELCDLQYATSAGTVALLTLMTTRWETIKLSVFRLITFVLTALVAWAAFMHIESTWVAYGVFIFVITIMLCLLDWRATISVNSVIGVQMLTQHDFSAAFVLNEFYLVLIGVVIALVFNLYHNHRGHRQSIQTYAQYSEQRIQDIIGELAAYLAGGSTEAGKAGAEIGRVESESREAGIESSEAGAEIGRAEAESSEAGIESSEAGAEIGRAEAESGSVWDHICSLEREMKGFLEEAVEYKENALQAHHSYFVEYFEMRLAQCQVLHNLHYEMRQIRTMPQQALVVAQYMLYLKQYVHQHNEPEKQLQELQRIFDQMREEALPVSREEFESRALLYHIMMDLEEFLVFKQRFVKSLDERQRKEYWNQK